MRIEIENVINTSTPKLARNGLYLFFSIHFFNIEKKPSIIYFLITVALYCEYCY